MSFTCRATIESNYMDSDNYPACSYETEMIHAETLPELYEEMAKNRIRNSRGTRSKYGEYTEVVFDEVMEVVSFHEFDENILESTNSWKAHEQSLLEQKRLDTTRREKEAADILEKTRQSELKMLATLKEKYGEV